MRSKKEKVKPYLKTLHFVFLVLTVCLLFSCSKSGTGAEQKDFSEISVNKKIFRGKKIPLQFATQFNIYEYEEGLSLIQAADNETYLVLPKDSSLLALGDGINCEQADFIIEQGLAGIYLAASSAYSLWQALSAQGQLRFSSIREEDWLLPSAKNAMQSGKFVYAGKYREPDYELLLKEKCPLAIESTMILHTPKVKEKLLQLGIKVFTDYSSYENDPLGRLEWIKVYGKISGHEKEAMLFFASQTKQLESLIQDKNSKKKSAAHFYINGRGMAVVRNSENYISNMLRYAGCEYLCPKSKNESSGKYKPASSVSVEDFFKSCSDADILFYDGNIDSSVFTLDLLKKKNPLLEEFKAVQNKNVWVFKKSIYQDTANVCSVILEINSIVNGNGGGVYFERLK